MIDVQFFAELPWKTVFIQTDQQNYTAVCTSPSEPISAQMQT